MTDKNLGFLFNCWDRMFGTYVSPRATGLDVPLHAEPTENRLLRMVLGI
jgi:sterol desaturase/sphingolipid hydroxylase (fatty acid hydroxylase superfamily)